MASLKLDKFEQHFLANQNLPLPDLIHLCFLSVELEVFSVSRHFSLTWKYKRFWHCNQILIPVVVVEVEEEVGASIENPSGMPIFHLNC